MLDRLRGNWVDFRADIWGVMMSAFLLCLVYVEPITILSECEACPMGLCRGKLPVWEVGTYCHWNNLLGAAGSKSKYNFIGHIYIFCRMLSQVQQNAYVSVQLYQTVQNNTHKYNPKNLRKEWRNIRMSNVRPSRSVTFEIHGDHFSTARHFIIYSQSDFLLLGCI
jgi:hypothetical protein